MHGKSPAYAQSWGTGDLTENTGRKPWFGQRCVRCTRWGVQGQRAPTTHMYPHLECAQHVGSSSHTRPYVPTGARGVVTAFSGASRLPVVRFVGRGGGSSSSAPPVVVTVGRAEFFVGGYHGLGADNRGGAAAGGGNARGSSGVLMRRQIPLDLGYALSIHRCQGMTLDRVEVDLRNAFECGQVR